MNDIVIEKTAELLRLDVSKIPIGKYKLVPIEEPNPELRDGDVVQWKETGNFVYLYDPDGAALTMQYVTTPLNHPYRLVLNILDLTTAVKRGEKIVTLTPEEIELNLSILMMDSADKTSLAKKLRAAMEEKHGND